MIQQTRANIVEARRLDQRRELKSYLFRAESQLEFFLAMLQKKHPNARKDNPNRLEHDIIRLLLDRMEKFLVDEVVYLRGNFQTTRADRADMLLDFIREAKAILLADGRPTTPLNRVNHG